MWNNWSLYFLALVMGMCGIGYEYTFSKISSDLMGQTTTQWAIIIGLMLLAMGLGADYQKKLSDHRLMEKFIFFEILLSLLGGFGAVFLVYVFGASRNYFVAVQISVSFSVGFLIGMEIPILARLNEKRLQNEIKRNTIKKIIPKKQPIKNNLAQILKMDYLGGFIGAILWATVMIRVTDSILKVAFLLSMINLLGVAVFARSGYGSSDRVQGLSLRQFTLFTLISLNFLLNGLGFFSVQKWTPFLEQQLFRDRVTYSSTTPYQHLVLTENKSGLVSFYINGNLQFTSFDEKIYHEWLVHPAFLISRAVGKILILGGGDGLALREVLKYSQVKKVTLVELDSQVIRLARENPVLSQLNQNSLSQPGVEVKHLPLLPPHEKRDLILPNRSFYPIQSSRETGFQPIELNVYHFDAVKWVEQVKETFDVIILDFPDPHALELSQLYALSFYRGLRRLLRPGGILVQQASSPIYTKESFLLIGRTLKEAGFNVLPYQATVPSFGPWGWWLAVVPSSSNSEWLKQRWQQVVSGEEKKKSWPVVMQHLTPELMRGGIAFPRNALVGKKKGYNTKLNHLAYRYYRESGEEFWW